ncbi:MAG: GNAT family N-acetyltransferase, partial [Anaerolineae bacterium]|nr:GNAT family N-acetyltransferase [Anaerolineae bacterium]
MTIEPPIILTTPNILAQPAYMAVPCSRYTFAELADIYNQSRVDYIVPMPMNAKRMEAYVRSYDVDLDASIVVFDGAGLMAGVGMLGVREDRAWITRVGVLPDRRGHNLGLFLMETLIDNARERDCRLIQLEVIKGNAPAHRLFLKLGFRETRELLVIRRPPGKPANPGLENVTMDILTPDEVQTCATQGVGWSWIEEPDSLLKVGGLRGLRVQLDDGASGWAIYQYTALQIAHIALH